MLTRFLRGPNLWAPVSVVEVEPGSLEFARLVLRLQQQSGSNVTYCDCRDRLCAIEVEEEEIGRRAAELAGSRSFDFDTALSELRELSEEVLMGPNTRVLAEAARRRGIPVRRLDRGTLLQLGHGFRQRRLSGTFTDRTSSIGENIGWEKPVAKAILREVGVPVPEGRRVYDAADAWSAARAMNAAVVIKPEAANHGRGVFLNLTEREEIEAAFAAASRAAENPAVLIERYVTGAEHRVLVVDRRVVAAMRGDPLVVSGDGRRTVRELVEEVNRDPRRGEEANAPLWAVEFDESLSVTLEAQGLQADSVVASGAQVLLQRNRNHSRDVTAIMHPENRESCVLAADAVGLDIAGIDLVCEDIRRPLRQQGAAILEVNAMPGIMMHLWPGEGDRQPVDDRIIEALYPPGTDGRVPIVAVNGGDVKTVADRYRKRGLFVSDRLLHPWARVVVMAVPDDLIERDGLPFDRCSLALFEQEPRTTAQRLLARVARRVRVGEAGGTPRR